MKNPERIEKMRQDDIKTGIVNIPTYIPFSSIFTPRIGPRCLLCSHKSKGERYWRRTWRKYHSKQ